MLNLTAPVLAATAAAASIAVGAVAMPSPSSPDPAPSTHGRATVVETLPVALLRDDPGRSDAAAGGDIPDAVAVTAAPASTTETTAILCGGYDEDGNLLDARAAETTEVPVDADGSYTIPDFCHGYTEDGVLVGDD